MEELNEVASLKHLHGIWDVAIQGSLVEIGHVEITSADLSRFLGTSKHAVMLAATLGTGVDAFMRKLMRTDMSKAVLADRLASQMIEEYINEVQAKMGLEGKRYSPGYGDFNIKHQQDILKMLKCEKIGLYMTESFMLVPSKSITAILPTNTLWTLKTFPPRAAQKQRFLSV